MENLPRIVNKRATESLQENENMEKKPKLENITSANNHGNPPKSCLGISIKSEPPSSDGEIKEEGEVSDEGEKFMIPRSEIKTENDLNDEESLEETVEGIGLGSDHGNCNDYNSQSEDMPKVQHVDNIDKVLKVVHIKNVHIDVNGKTLPLLQKFTKFPIYHKFYFIRKLRDESKRIMDEILLKFNDPADAAMVATCLNSVTYEDRLLQAELIDNIPHSRVYKPDSRGVNGEFGSNSNNSEEISEAPKIAKFDDAWEVANPKRKVAWTTRRTEDTFGINPSILRKFGADQFLSQCISVSNLHEDVTEAKLHEVFSMAGNISYMKYKEFNKRNKYNINDRDKYKARIEYEHPVEALQAVSMFNGQNLYGLDLKVELFILPSPRALPAGLGGIGKGFGHNEQPLRSVPTYVYSRKMYEIFHDMGKVQKTVDNQHSFLGYYNYNSAPVISSDMYSGINKKYTAPSKPNTDTAIEALGAVLVALDLIPPQTNHKDLKSIVNALQQHPKVQQHAASKKNQQINNVPKKQKSKQQRPINPTGKRDASYQEFIRSLNNQSDFLQSHASNTGQRTSNPGPQGATNRPFNKFGANINNTWESNDNPGVQNAASCVSNMNQNQTNPGAPANMNPNSAVHNQNRHPNTSNPRYGMPNMHQNVANTLNMSQNIPEAFLPPRWGDPRSQGIPHNIPQQNPTANRNFPPNSNSIAPNRHPNPSDFGCHSESQTSRPHYDPRNDNSRREEINSRDNFKSDLLQLKNLPASVNSKTLVKKMEEVGEIIFAEMTGRGQALVRYKRIEDADRCIRLFHRSKVDGNVVDVSPV